MIIVTKMAELVKRFCGKCHFMKNKVSPSPTPPPRECAGEGKKCCPRIAGRARSERREGKKRCPSRSGGKYPSNARGKGGVLRKGFMK